MCGDYVLQPSEVANEDRPLFVGERHLPVIAPIGRPRGEDNDLGSGGGKSGDRRSRFSQIQRGINMQRNRQKATDQAHVVNAEVGTYIRRLRAEVTGRAKVRGAQAKIMHLGEHAVGGQFVAPPGGLAYTPRNGRTGNPVDGGSGVHAGSSYRWGYSLRIDLTN